MRNWKPPRSVTWLLLCSLAAACLFGVALADVGSPESIALADVHEVGRPLPNETEITGMSREQIENVKKTAKRFEFQSDIAPLMKLIVNSLYKAKEIFLRELISNASDALDKIRFLSLTDKKALATNPELEITIKADQKNRVLVIRDTGVGMTMKDLKDNLGTIAKSGTAEFISRLEHGADVGLIGEFGVGFYSIFLVADRAVVVTKHNDDKQYIWESRAVNDFTIAEDPRGDTLGRGTEVTLYLKDDAVEFLDQETLRKIIQKYSRFINFPIRLWTTKTETVEEEEEEKEQEVKQKDGDEEDAKDHEEKDDEAEVEDVDEATEKETKKKKTKEITREDWEVMNGQKAIWLRDPKNVSDTDYAEFYNSFYKDREAPLSHNHFKTEGDVEFRCIMFIPSKAPPNYYNSFKENQKNVKLFVRRVFITDEIEGLMPNYLAFIRAVVDSDDLPLNVSRETLQQHKMLKLIKKYLVRKALDMLTKLSEDVGLYSKFYAEFGTSIKLGVMEDSNNQKKLARLLRFHSSHDAANMTSLSEYVERMKKGQKQIFYLDGTSVAEIKRSPFVERLLARGYEVLYLPDGIDEHAIQRIPDFEGHRFQSLAKKGLNFGDEDDADKKKNEAELAERFKPLADWLKEKLSDAIEKVEISNRLTISPCAIVANEYGWSGNMERIMRSQALAQKNDFMLDFYANQKKILEINPKHPLIEGLLKKVVESTPGPEVEEVARVLYETTLIRSGYALKESAKFAARVEKIMRKVVDVDPDLEAEQDPEYVKPAEEKPHPIPEDGEVGKPGEEADEEADSKEDEEAYNIHDEL